MHFFNAIRSTIENGFETASATVGAIWRTYTIGIVNQARRPEEDIEMSAFGHDDDDSIRHSLINNTTGNEYTRRLRASLSQLRFFFRPFGSIRIPFIRRPLSRTTKIFRILARVRMPTIPQLESIRRFIHSFDELDERLLIIVCCVGTVWLALEILGFRLLLLPMGHTTYEITLHNFGRLRDIMPIWNEPKFDHSTLDIPDQMHILGAAFLVTNLEAISDIAPVTAVSSMLPASPAQDIAKDIPEATIDTNSVIAKRHARDGFGPPHHAYPIHAGRVDKRPQALRIKSQLERCAENMLAKLKGQGLEITPSFEFALHDCKSIIDFALDTLYAPKKVPAAKVKEISKRSMFYGVIPGGRPQNSATKHISRGLNDCSKGFCDWVSTSNLDRCYRRNEQRSQEKGKPIYSNDSVDDFKDTAPLECNLCLPEPDQEGINEHCKDVGRTEYDVLMSLVCFAAALGSAVMLGMVIQIGVAIRARRHVHVRGAHF